MDHATRAIHCQRQFILRLRCIHLTTHVGHRRRRVNDVNRCRFSHRWRRLFCVRRRKEDWKSAKSGTTSKFLFFSKMFLPDGWLPRWLLIVSAFSVFNTFQCYIDTSLSMTRLVYANGQSQGAFTCHRNDDLIARSHAAHVASVWRVDIGVCSHSFVWCILYSGQTDLSINHVDICHCVVAFLTWAFGLSNCLDSIRRIFVSLNHCECVFLWIQFWIFYLFTL